MKVVWMGQSGLLFVSGKDKIVIDPYLTNDMYKHDKGFHRAMKINKKFFCINPNIIILTNASPDHTDIGTLTRYIYKSKNLITIICSSKAYEAIKTADMPKRCNIVAFEDGSEWTYKEINITATKSKTNDASGFGVLLTDGASGKKYYVSSATRYNKEVFDSLPNDIDTAFIPINGFDGAMNIYDAKRFAEKIGAKNIVPVHYGMFDSINPKDLDVPNKIIPQIYKVINLENEDNKKDISLDKKFNESLPNKKGESSKKDDKNSALADKNSTKSSPKDETEPNKSSDFSFDELDDEFYSKEDAEDDISKKLDAYMQEIEKFQNGGTADFSKIDSDN